MRWFLEMGSRVGDNLRRSRSAETKRSAAGTQLGILAFETAKTMARLISLYESLADSEIGKLRKEVIRSEGVGYLNSKDEGFLLSLACAEKLEDLDKIAATVTRLGQKCSDSGLTRFGLVYTDLKLGTIDLDQLEYASKEKDRLIAKMEKLISATSRLYAALEALSELEVSEQKMKLWKKNSSAMKTEHPGFDAFQQKIAYQRKQVHRLREASLWSKTFDKGAGLMARFVCVVYARLCSVFRPYISSLPHHFLPSKNTCHVGNSRSGPIPKTNKLALVRFHSQDSLLFSPEDSGFKSKSGVFQAARPTTVGGSGLAARYADVILLAARYLDPAMTISENARESLYQMLPENLKTLVRLKLRKSERVVAPEGDGQRLAEGWREAMRGILEWLAPMAHDTLKWKTESNIEAMKFEAKKSVLLMQTLHFSDREKVEAAIAELLVGLSHIYWYEDRRNCGDGNVDVHDSWSTCRRWSCDRIELR